MGVYQETSFKPGEKLSHTYTTTGEPLRDGCKRAVAAHNQRVVRQLVAKHHLTEWVETSAQLVFLKALAESSGRDSENNLRIIKVRKTSPPPKKTPRVITLEITEGELDFLACLTARAIGMNPKTPAKYAKKLLPKLEDLLGGDVEETSDAFRLSSGIIRFWPYKTNAPVTRARKIESLPLPDKAAVVLGYDPPPGTRLHEVRQARPW